MNFEIDPKIYEEISKEINSDASPVGIDAKHTHVVIINKLIEISERLERIERELAK